MSAPAIIPLADLTRMAKVAKTHGVAITTEINGRKFTVSPVTPDVHNPSPIDIQPENFTSLDDYQAWRDKAREGDAKRHS